MVVCWADSQFGAHALPGCEATRNRLAFRFLRQGDPRKRLYRATNSTASIFHFGVTDMSTLSLSFVLSFIGLAVALVGNTSFLNAQSQAQGLDVVWRGNFSTDRTRRVVSLKLLVWNINRGLQLSAITDAIQRGEHDVCIFQEVDLNARRTHRSNVAEELARRFKLNYVFGAEFQELSQGSRSSPAYHGQATLTGLPIRSQRILRFTHQTDYWKPRWYLPNWTVFQRRMGGRMALVVDLNVDGKTLVIYNAHLESKISEEGRLLQLEEILADMARYPPETPIILAGDLNTKSESSLLTRRLKQMGFQNSIESVVPTTRLKSGRSGLSLARWFFPFSKRRKGREKDWIFVRGPLQFEDGKVHGDILASDHYPLSVKVTLIRDERCGI